MTRNASEFAHCDLRAWVFKENPLGMFAPANSDVNCGKGQDFSLLEKPTKIAPWLPAGAAHYMI